MAQYPPESSITKDVIYRMLTFIFVFDLLAQFKKTKLIKKINFFIFYILNYLEVAFVNERPCKLYCGNAKVVGV